MLASTVKKTIALLLVLNSLLLYQVTYIGGTHGNSHHYNTLTNRYENSPQVNYKHTTPWLQYLGHVNIGQSPYLQVQNQDDYCRRVSEHQKAANSSLRIVFSDYRPGNIVKSVLRATSELVLPNHHIRVLPSTPVATLPTSINLFYHKSPMRHLHHLIGLHFLCPGQRYNHIPGSEHLTDKADILKHALHYEKLYTGRPDCFSAWNFIPETYDLAEESQCIQLMRLLQRSDSNEIQWISKVSRGSHNSAGIELLTPENRAKLLRNYENGTTCGAQTAPLIVQKYIQNPLLLNNRKFDFRVYLLIASMEPLVLLYHDGFLRFSLAEYNTSSAALGTHLTNTQLAKEASKGLSESESAQLLQEQMWTMHEFASHMTRSLGLPQDWVESSFLPQLKQQLFHLVRMGLEDMLSHPGVFELFGVDFMLDSELHLWFLEMTKSPAMEATTPQKGEILRELIEGVLDIEYALLAAMPIDPLVQRYNFSFVYDGRLPAPARYSVLPSRCI